MSAKFGFCLNVVADGKVFSESDMTDKQLYSFPS